ncbi:MAG: hypothetical protein IIA82_08485 [Thaumarchaeota archaeon]|nr:hypothetical protein [Nitrososphaerota archaeon]
MKRLVKKTNEKSKTELDLLNEISLKLDKVIGILACSSIKEPRNKIPLLKNLGFTIEDTANITELTIDVVKKERSKLKDSKK